jgi:hypothetical protein
MTPLEDALLERYERFTSVLCLAAQYGPDTRREQMYTEVREWVRANQDGLPPLLSRAEITTQFFQLFEPETLRELLQSDSGDLIANVGHISEALYAATE